MEIGLDQLQEYFKTTRAAYWKVFSGKATRGTPVVSNLELENFDDSWEALNTALDFCEGVVTVTFHTSPKARASSAISVDLGGGTTLSNSKTTRTITGGSMVNQMTEMLKLMQLMQNMNGNNNSVDIESIRKQAVMEHEFEGMKKYIEDGPHVESPKEVMMMEMAKAIPMAVNGIGSMFGIPMMPYQQPAQLGTLGQETSDENQTEETTKAPPVSNANLAVSMDHFINDARRIMKAIPGIHPNTLWNAIANLSEKNPAEASMYMTKIISDYGQK